MMKKVIELGYTLVIQKNKMKLGYTFTINCKA